MNTKNRFPSLSENEFQIVSDFERANASEKGVIDLMLQFSESFRDAKTAQERIENRTKLLELAGLFELIPVERFESAKNAPLSLTLLELRIEGDEDPFKALMRCGEIPFDMLVNFPNFKEFFNVKRPDGPSYQQELLRKQAEIGGVLVVLNNRINDQAQNYISASSEPLTRSILLNPWIDGRKDEIRDFASMAYDLVMQMEFLSIFYQQKATLNRIAVQAAMRLEGLSFVLDTFSFLLKRAIDGDHVDFKIDPSEVLLINKSASEGAELCRYLKYLLYSLAGSNIDQLNQILGIELSELEISKVLLEHSVGFDPRRIQMKLLGCD